MSRSRWFAVVAGLALGCATARPLSEATARSLAQHGFEGEGDVVLDAVWLTLAAKGYVATAHDAVIGRVSLTAPGGHGYDVSVQAGEAEQLVTAMPRSPRPLVLGGPDGEDAKWGALWRGTAALLEAWREVPEWTYETRTNTLRGAGCAFEPPKAWAYLDFDIHRQRARVKQFRGHRDAPLNPSVLAVIERRSPRSTLPELLRETAGVALTARNRLTLPDDLEAMREPGGLGGTLQVLDGTTPREVRWHSRVESSGAWTVTLVAVCGEGEEACDDAWLAATRSVRCGP